MWVKVRSTHVEDHSESRPDVWSGRGIEVDPATVEVTSEAAPAAPRATSEPLGASAAEPSTDAVTVDKCVTDCALADAKEPTRDGERAEATKTKPATSTERRATPTASAVSSATAPTASASSSGTGSSAGEAYGAVGLPPGVRHLPTAYARAFPQGNWGVAAVRSAPVGKLCDAHIQIAIHEDRSLGAVEYPDERERDALSPLCRTMLENAHRLVARGEFSLDPKTLTTGVLRLHIEVEVSEGEARADLDPSGLWDVSNDTTTVVKRGKGWFILNSGRRVDAFIGLE